MLADPSPPSTPHLHLDPINECVWRDAQCCQLTPTTFAVLRYLIEHAGRLVSKQELMRVAWPETTVSEWALVTCMRRLRQALRDPARAPQCIETVHRRGYRFIASATVLDPAAPVAPSPPAPLTPLPLPQLSPLVGREAELAQLHSCLAKALRGTRQLVFVTGEPGIGKTTVVEAFLEQAAATGQVWVGRGQCIAHYGPGEAYLPVLEILGRLGRQPDGAHFVDWLRQYAPTWLVQLPVLSHVADPAALQHAAIGATPARMLRELVEALDVLTRERALVLSLEDLQWSDASTLTMLAMLARRQEPARLLVVGTYRPVDVLLGAHPLQEVQQELQLHGHCQELPLTLLNAAAITAYVAQRFAGGAHLPLQALAQALHRRTEGHPLFMVNMVEEWVSQGLIRRRHEQWELCGELAAVEVPTTIRQFITQQLERISVAERALLEAASVAGAEFSAAALAAAIDAGLDTVEAQCAVLAQRGQFIEARGLEEWPDGTVASRYGFLHALYQETIYERVPASRRWRWHQQLGMRLEAGYGPQARERAAELAEHFMRGRDAWRAVQYLHYAGEQAVQRSAHQEALQHFTRGLDLLATLPETPARTQRHLDLQLALGPVVIATRGIAAPEVEQCYARARVLCAQVGETPQLFPTLQGLWRFYRGRGALLMAQELGEQLLRLAESTADPTYRLEAHEALGNTLFYLGDYAAALTHLEQGSAHRDVTTQRTIALRHGLSPGVMCLAVAANVLHSLGRPAQAVQRSQEALALAQALAHPYSLVNAQFFAAWLSYLRRDAPAVQSIADTLFTLATTQGFPLYVGYATCWRGWALAMQGEGDTGLTQLRQGIAAVMATGTELIRPFWCVLLAEAAGHVGQIAEGLGLLAEARTVLEARGQGDMLAEAYRLEGTFLLHRARPAVEQASRCFQQALAVAQHQQAHSWELRAAVSLGRLWQRQGKLHAARQLLSRVYDGFTEGFDTADLHDAQTLLQALR